MKRILSNILFFKNEKEIYSLSLEKKFKYKIYAVINWEKYILEGNIPVNPIPPNSPKTLVFSMPMDILEYITGGFIKKNIAGNEKITMYLKKENISLLKGIRPNNDK